MTADTFNKPSPTDFRNAVALPKPKLTKIEDLPPEIQAQLREGWARMLAGREILAEAERQKQELAKGYECNDYIAPPPSHMSRERVLYQIEHVGELIQSGEAENYTLSTSYNGRATSDFRQYLYWLQQHAKSLEGSASSTLAQA